MINNDILRRTRYALDLSDSRLQDLMRRGLKLSGQPVDERLADSAGTALSSWLAKEADEGFEECPDLILNAFLDGLVEHLRGKSNTAPAPLSGALTNNMVMRKLKIALALRSEAMLADIRRGGGKTTASELGAIFRKTDHRNYQKCGDQLLRRFLHGLVLRMRPDMPDQAQRAQFIAEKELAEKAAQSEQTESSAKGVWPNTKPASSSAWPARSAAKSGSTSAPASAPTSAMKPAGDRAKKSGQLSLPESTQRRTHRKKKR